MKIYNGWIIRINGIEWTINGSGKIRSNQFYYIRNPIHGKASIGRERLLTGLSSGAIQYIASTVAA